VHGLKKHKLIIAEYTMTMKGWYVLRASQPKSIKVQDSFTR